MENIGIKIRTERKKKGLTLAELAKQVGISAITLQRIETGKSSPSVTLLYEIAQTLNKNIFPFFEESKPFILIKRKDHQVISGPGMKVTIIGPRKMINGKILVTCGEHKKMDPHSHPGTEWVYVIEGQCEFKLNNKTYFLEAGDSIAYNGRLEHSMNASQKRTKFFAIHVKDE